MLFRPQRGMLADAMKEVVEVDGLIGLLEHLESIHPKYGTPFDRNKIRVEPYGGEDKRIGWKDVHIVIQDGWGPVGFTDCKPT